MVSCRRATYRCSRCREVLPVVDGCWWLLLAVLVLLELTDMMLPSVEAEASPMGHWLPSLNVGQVRDLHRFECRGRRVLSPVLPVARMKM